MERVYSFSEDKSVDVLMCPSCGARTSERPIKYDERGYIPSKGKKHYANTGKKCMVCHNTLTADDPCVRRGFQVCKECFKENIIGSVCLTLDENGNVCDIDSVSDEILIAYLQALPDDARIEPA